MFDEAKEPVDIFAETDKPLARAPMVPGSASTSPVRAQYAAAAGGPSKLLLIIIGVVVLLGAGGAGAYFMLKGKSAPEQSVVAPVNGENPPAEQPAPEPTQPPAEQPAPEPTQPPPAVTPPQPEAPVVPPDQATAPLDTDGDGLTDAEEAQLGTNPQMVDTDNDGLTDREEVMIYKTNPLNPDTDGDSYLDGMEVKGGYNPNGPGKLFDVPPKN